MPSILIVTPQLGGMSELFFLVVRELLHPREGTEVVQVDFAAFSAGAVRRFSSVVFVATSPSDLSIIAGFCEKLNPFTHIKARRILVAGNDASQNLDAKTARTFARNTFTFTTANTREIQRFVAAATTDD